MVQQEDGSPGMELYSVYVPTNHIYVGDIFLLGREDVIHTNLSVREGLGETALLRLHSILHRVLTAVRNLDLQCGRLVLLCWGIIVLLLHDVPWQGFPSTYLFDIVACFSLSLV